MSTHDDSTRDDIFIVSNSDSEEALVHTEASPSVALQNITQASLSEKDKQILSLAGHGMLPMSVVTEIPHLKAIFSQATTSTSILQAQPITEQLSEANKGDSLALETVVSQPETTR